MKSDNKLEKSIDKKLPMNYVAKGDISKDDVRIYINQRVYKELNKYSKSNTENELGSILVGFSTVENNKTHVVLEDWIEAKHTDATASTLTFTHDTWEYIHKEHEVNHDDKVIVGWQHTHPDYGIFLSNYDLFIHENFFSQSFEVAYVIDPIKKTRGFFQWRDGNIEQVKGYYIYDDVGKPIKIKDNTDISSIEDKKIGIGSLVAGVILVVCISIILSIYFKSYNRNIAALSHELTSNQAIIMQQDEDIKDLEEKLSKKDDKIEIDLTSEQIQKIIASEVEKKLSDNNGEKNIEAAVESCKHEDTDSIVLKKYKIQKGDTLSEICQKLNICYNENINLIKNINVINNINAIQADTEIYVPIEYD